MSLIDDLGERAGDIAENARDRVESILDALEGRLGSRRRAQVALGAAAAVVAGLAVVGIASIPVTSAPAPMTQPAQTDPGDADVDADDENEDEDVTAPGGVGSGVSADDRADEADERNAEENVPDQAKTVRELADARYVEAKVTGVVDGTHLLCELVNGDTVTVRLIGVAPTDDCILEPNGAIPFDLASNDRSVYLERDDVTMEEDGTWPRYLWTTDPRKQTSTSSVPWQAYGCRPNVGWFTYAPEDGLDRYKATFEAQESWGVDLTAEAEQKRQEKLEREWAERKEEQERLEAEQDAEHDDSSSDANEGKSATGTDGVNGSATE